MKVGQRVKYSDNFLRSIGMYHSDMRRARGVVQEVTECGPVKLATMIWNVSDLPARVNVRNLSRA